MGDLTLERRCRLVDPGVEVCDLFAEPVDVVEHHLHDDAVVIGEEPSQRFLQDGVLGPHATFGEAGKVCRVALAVDQRVERLAT